MNTATGRWACRQQDVYAALDRDLEAEFGAAFAALDAERLRRLVAPFVGGAE